VVLRLREHYEKAAIIRLQVHYLTAAVNPRRIDSANNVSLGMTPDKNLAPAVTKLAYFICIAESMASHCMPDVLGMKYVHLRWPSDILTSSRQMTHVDSAKRSY
jgi:hypothetical protein